ncbi:DUF4291 domain-containing protein [Micromonospora peucetia]|uniref:DUF4291 domain-containing protein n=1 Tax=Micromonospora peucetia TaxID=47871 RepID=A0A1C6W403_9ACTN|nr:DUF4291 domain-containing protein [Micromonospora peucetia]MCX4390309.1 DUF4291 domain-containing protein [Micromonospora peucetia]WSA32387.1 DUF4291 domain-containing protein [Micromonospora peucetia]SCL73248.1 protein of unknown function (DUF4291) [Micromonospora peucetia]
MQVPVHQVRARFTADTVTVYQAYPPEIALPALAAGRFVPPFKRERMTWIKPSFRWMMYRCGWGTKPGQERVLAVEITRAGFEWALAHSCPSSFDRDQYQDRETWSRQLRASPVRVQWDPERSLRLAPLPHRSLQVGLSGEAVRRYVDEWLVGLTDATPTAHAVRAVLDVGDDTAAEALLPPERPYPLPPDLAAVVAGGDLRGLRHVRG